MRNTKKVQEKKYRSAIFLVFDKVTKKPEIDEAFYLLDDAVAYIEEYSHDYDNKNLVVVEYIPTATYSPPSVKDWIKESLTE